ncbi:MAG: tetratricopeptide repeat protein [Burkholderiaceae bacterium]
MLLLSLAANSAHASEYTEIQRLANAGQTHLALVRVEKGIAQNPKDPQLRFLQGVIQADSGMVDAAEQTFIALTRLYPELPEPYNNLAALYAKSNRFGKAREALESALRLNPNYAVAHENLGDVYARLAAESYASAQQLDQTNPRLAPKLTLARQLLNGAAVTPQ